MREVDLLVCAGDFHIHGLLRHSRPAGSRNIFVAAERQRVNAGDIGDLGSRNPGHHPRWMVFQQQLPAAGGVRSDAQW